MTQTPYKRNEDGSSAGPRRVRRSQQGECDSPAHHQRKLFEEIAPGVIHSRDSKNLDDPEQGEDCIKKCQQKSGTPCSPAPQSREPKNQLVGGREVGERFTIRHIGLDALPVSCKIAPHQTHNAERNGGHSVEMKPDIR